LFFFLFFVLCIGNHLIQHCISLSTWGFTFEYHRWCKLTAVHHHHLSFFLFKLVQNASEHFTYYVFKFLFHVQAGRPSLSQILNQ